MPNAISLPEGQRLLAEVRKLLMQFPEVVDVLSEQGRPEDGTDTIGPNQSETFIHLHPQEEWKTGRSKEQLVAAMRQTVAHIPGVLFNFSQPIADNVEEAISGIRGQIVVKIYGEDQYVLQEKANQVLAALKTVREVEDPAVYRTGKIPHLVIELDRPRIARYGLTIIDVERVIETAIGGRVATESWEGEKRFGIRVLLAEPNRSEEHTSELQLRLHLVCRLLLEKKKKTRQHRALRTFSCFLLLLIAASALPPTIVTQHSPPAYLHNTDIGMPPPSRSA